MCGSVLSPLSFIYIFFAPTREHTLLSSAMCSLANLSPRLFGFAHPPAPNNVSGNRFQYGIPYPDYFGYAPLACSAPIPNRLPSDAILVRSTERFYLCVPDACLN